MSSDRYWVYCWLILTVHSLLSLENIITNFPGFTLALVPGYYANQLLDFLYLYLPLREIGVRWANHESACHSSRAARKASSQPPKAKPQFQQPVNQAAGRGRGGQASSGKPNKASRGRGRGGGGSEAETFLTSIPLHC